MARMNQKEEELILDTVNHITKCVRYMSECYTLTCGDLGKLDELADKLAECFGKNGCEIIGILIMKLVVKKNLT